MLKKLTTIFQVDSSTNALQLVTNFVVPLVVLEFILLRFLSRMGPALPRTEAVIAAFQVVFLAGEIALNMAFFLSIFALALISVILAHRGGLFVGLPLMIFSVISVGLLFFVASDPVISLVYSLLSLAVVALCTTQLIPQKNAVRLLFLVVLSITYFCSYYYKIASSVAGMGVGVIIPMASEVFSAGESLALIAASLAFLAFKPKWNVSAVIISSTITVVLAFAWWTTWLPLVTILALNFTLHLPIVMYVVALWLYTYLIVDAYGEGRKRLLAHGLLLIALNVRMLQLTYLNQLAILGFLLLSMQFESKNHINQH